METKEQSQSLENLDNMLNESLELLEYIIQNRSEFQEPIKYHTVPTNTKFYIDYKYNENISLPELIDNTFQRYLNNLENGKKVYEKQESFNKEYSNKRFKNYIPKYKIKHIKQNKSYILRENSIKTGTNVSKIVYKLDG